MTGSEIRRRFLEYFRRREHLVLESASLVPVDDPTTLFISAGMQPLQPYFLGLKRPPAPRLTSCQKCFRVGDLEQVGRTDRHQTFFEMLGNFAPTGDYFKRDAIRFAHEFVTDRSIGLGLDPARLHVTTHPSDDEARRLWREEAGLSAAVIHEEPSNWWGLELGPCGPDSELWWDRGREAGCGQEDCAPDHCERYLEFWNLVFPEFDRQLDGALKPLPRPAIDTGMGLERVTALVQGVADPFATDLMKPLLEFVRQESKRPHELSERVIADHLRAAVFAIADGVLPSNEGRGYVLRRLIRRAAFHARRSEMTAPLASGVEVVLRLMADHYPYLAQRRSQVEAAIQEETGRFGRTLEQGLEIFEQVAARSREMISGEDAFRLHDTFGFPLALTRELAEERELGVDEEAFQVAMAEQRRRSRGQVRHDWAAEARSLPGSSFVGYEMTACTATVLHLRRDSEPLERALEGEGVEVFLDVTPFYAESGGQVGDSGALTAGGARFVVEDTQRPYPGVVAHLGRVVVGSLAVGDSVAAEVDFERRRQIMRHHSATHLLNRALEIVLGRKDLQRGSYVGPDRTTFDFAFERGLTAGELVQVSRLVNQKVREALACRVEEMDYEAAVATGATHLFEERYSERVRVVSFGDFSREFCGGTHVANSADVGPAVIVSEAGVAGGVRRIEMVAGTAAEALIDDRLSAMRRISRELGVGAGQVEDRLSALKRELRDRQRELEEVQDQLRQARVRGGGAELRRRPARVPLVAEEVEARNPDELRAWADRYLEALGGRGVVALASGPNFVVKVSRDLSGEFDAKRLAAILGRGGGRPEMAQGRLDLGAKEGFARLEEALR